MAAMRALRPVIAWLALVSVAALAGEPGGVLTRTTDNRNAFALPAPSLDARELRDFNFGNRLFNTNWLVAPASVDAFDGLGPTFNRVSCSGCHLRDGRGRPPIDGERELLSMLVRLSVPGNDAHGGPRPHPAYGDQLNDRAIPGVAPEGRVEIRYQEQAGRYPDGSAYSLRVPRYRLLDPAYGEFGDDIMISPRVAPHMVGMGLLEAVSEADIRVREDPEDRDGDGVSGRVNRVFDPTSGNIAIGRFGWKANAASLRQQSAAAAAGDIGLSSAAFAAQNCPPAQHACIAAANGGAPELTESFLDKLVFYLRALAVPARRHAATPEVQRGAVAFEQVGCGACHTPSLRTAARGVAPEWLRAQDFAPYTDLLLHDMGEGLADGRPDHLANGREWRTPPLWGLGLVPIVNEHRFLLHDGRARNFEEAILWHGGEAESSRLRFMALARGARDDVVAFLESL